MNGKRFEEAPNYILNEAGVVINTLNDRQLKIHSHSGYPSVNLLVGGTYVKRRIDQLVAKTFYGTTISEKPRGRKKERKWIIDRETGEQFEIF